MNIIFLSIVLTFLVGCATPGDLTKSPALAEFDSVKSLEQVSGCIGSGWANYSATIANVPMENGTMISLNHPLAGVDATAVITKLPNGTHIRYAERMPRFSPKWMKDIVVSCK